MARSESSPALAGSFRLFQVAGISVYMHWSWLLIAYFEIQYRVNMYSSQAWNVAEYVTLFAIVLIHEFGHVLACRKVGGKADQIVLWPLGGIAFVSPPPRPGAVLWSIAAGPLVNVVLVPLTVGAYVMAAHPAFREIVSPDMNQFLFGVSIMNLSLLIFNMLPIYPLDGGQILQALLWFVIGRAKSLLVVSVIGMVAGVAVLIWAITAGDVWIAIIAFFAASRSLAGFKQARAIATMLNAPKHENITCPSCHSAPALGEFWTCNKCRTRFDTFAHEGICPGCGNQFDTTMCPSCGQTRPISSWYGANSHPANSDDDQRAI
jgi:Zn-dependent protease